MFSLARRLCSVGGRFGPPSSVYSCSLFKRPLSTEQHQGPKKRPKKCKEGSGEQHLSADEYVKFRKDQLRKANKTLYPQKFDVRHKVKNVLKDYEHLEKGETAEAAVSVAGRIHGIRAASKKLHFIDLRSEVDAGIQIKANLKNYGGGDPDAFADDVHVLRRGDVVGIDGVPCRTEAGELSVAASKVTLLAPCLRVMPNQHVGFEIRDKRFRRRHVDFLANPERRDIFRTRAAVIRELRRFLEERDFLEVETPVLGSGYGGAAARPFRTFHNDLDIEMFLRIAPELYLKQLVVGGFDRVFEIGRQFRNEGLDATHNPEFTTCEFYEAYADYHDLMGTTEEMLRKIVGAVRDGGLQVPYLMKQRGSEEREEVLIDFEKPFERLDYLSAIESAAGRQLPSAQDVDEDGEEGRKYLKSIHVSANLSVLPDLLGRRKPNGVRKKAKFSALIKRVYIVFFHQNLVKMRLRFTSYIRRKKENICQNYLILQPRKDRTK
jgi:lysyl-tRNA synthetase class 2